MSLFVKSTPRAHRLSAVLWLIGFSLSLACLAWATAVLVLHGISLGLMVLVLIAFLGIAWLGLVGLKFDPARLRPRTVRVENDLVQLVVQDQICGQVPFANIEMIRNLWNKDDRPYWDRTVALTEVAGVMVTGAHSMSLTWWFWMFTDRMQEKSRGVIIVVKDDQDKNTWWPRRDFNQNKKQLYITGHWEMRYSEMVERLRDEEMGYLQRHGLIREPMADESLFDFQNQG